jgi:hypothetical protein
LKAALVSAKVCYVCNKNIKDGAEIYIGQGNYRHAHCAPGTARWLNSRHVRTSPYRDLWKAFLNRSLKTGGVPSADLFIEQDKKIRNVVSDSRQMTLF